MVQIKSTLVTLPLVSFGQVAIPEVKKQGLYVTLASKCIGVIGIHDPSRLLFILHHTIATKMRLRQ